MKLHALPLPLDPPVLQLLEADLTGARREERLDLADAQVGEPIWHAALLDPLRAFFASPGKQLRADLVALGFALAGGRGAPPERLGLLIEVLHSGSLIVDDIEDGSETRRGAPALHVSHGLSRALNAGNTLYFWAEEMLSDLGLSAAQELEARRLFSRTMFRAHHGQALDVSIPVTRVAQEDVLRTATAVSRLKTGALVELAMGLAALVAGASPATRRALERFGAEFGVALQALDDLSGILPGPRRDKGREDLLGLRPTWAFAWAAEELDASGWERLLSDTAHLSHDPRSVDRVADEIAVLVEPRGRTDVHTRLERALFLVSPVVHDAGLLARLRRLMDKLENSYG